MPLQARALATQQAILDAAADVFVEVGYARSSLTEIMDRAHVTKGAFYYHFQTRESVARALMEYADDAVAEILEETLEASELPALEGLVRSKFLIIDAARSDKRVRVGFWMSASSGLGPPGQAANRRDSVLMKAVLRAVEEGDVTADLDPADVSRSLWLALLDDLAPSFVERSDDLAPSSGVLGIVLRGICTPASYPFFGHFLARATQRSAGGRPSR